MCIDFDDDKKPRKVSGTTKGLILALAMVGVVVLYMVKVV